MAGGIVVAAEAWSGGCRGWYSGERGRHFGCALSCYAGMSVAGFVASGEGATALAAVRDGS